MQADLKELQAAVDTAKKQEAEASSAHAREQSRAEAALQVLSIAHEA